MKSTTKAKKKEGRFPKSILNMIKTGVKNGLRSPAIVVKLNGSAAAKKHGLTFTVNQVNALRRFHA